MRPWQSQLGTERYAQATRAADLLAAYQPVAARVAALLQTQDQLAAERDALAARLARLNPLNWLRRA